MITTIAYYVTIGIGIAITLYVVIGLVVMGIVAAIQEAKVWKSKQLPSFNTVGYIKAFGLNATWCFGGVIFSPILALMHYASLGMIDAAHYGNTFFEPIIGKLVYYLWIGKVEVINPENLPTDQTQTPAPVYIANHSSTLDVAGVYFLDRKFKWVSSFKVLFIPGVGGIMYFGKHILVKKVGKNRGKSVKNLYDTADAAVQNGLPMLIFPQGTRKITEKLPFKDGAFRIAIMNKCPIIPMTIEVPTQYNPWNTLYPLSLLWGEPIPVVKFIIHKTVQVDGTEDLEELKDRCMKIIYSPLPAVYDCETKKIE